MILVWSVPFFAGLVVATFASRRAVTHALLAADAANVSAGVIGMTVLAIGTDLPEIANSIVAALTGHGDVAVGDSVGSALTQVTFVLAILCLGAQVTSERSVVAPLGLYTVGALLVLGVLVRDGSLSRLDGMLLVTLWVLSLLVYRSRETRGTIHIKPARSMTPHVLRASGWLLLVAMSSMLVVRSFVAITDELGVPELIASAVVLALGTSLPELVVDWTAIRRGAVALALGDLFGSSLVDATLAVGIGPALRAISVSDGAVLLCVIAAAGVGLATLIMISRPVHHRRSAAMLFAVYLVAGIAIVSLAA